MKFENQNKASPVPGYVAADHPQQDTKRALQLVTNKPPKKRQKSGSTRVAIVDKYKSDLKSSWIADTTTITPWFALDGYQLECKRVNANNLPAGFVKVGTEDRERYQYNFTDPIATTKTRFRPTAYRMSFLEHSSFYEKSTTVSHLCHNNWCYNWNHHVFEPLPVNKTRNGCPSGPHCHHVIKCLIPGEFSQS